MKNCKTCAAAWNTLNGRYCGPLKTYVDNATIPPCNHYDYDNRTTTSEPQREAQR